MNVLIGCEFSGTVRDAFAERGHNAWSCDLLPTDKPGQHLQMDVREALRRPVPMKRARTAVWDLFIAHPSCTYLTNSGVRWLHEQPERWALMREGALFFLEMLNADVEKVAVENPIMHKYAIEIIGRRQDQCIQPFQFGHPERKATCLWLRNLPLLVPTDIVPLPADKAQAQRIFWATPSPDRWKLRSTTFPGIARAMAAQWG